jgi:hypothetical protein
MMNIINIAECEIKDSSFCNYFVFDKFLYELCLIGEKEKSGKERAQFVPMGMSIIC